MKRMSERRNRSPRAWYVPTLSLLLLLSGSLLQQATAQPLGTAFTYQGQLTESGQAATGLYDLQICLFDTPDAAVAIACAPDFADVPVEDGLFTLAVDFGSAPFVGQQRFLELRVRPGASAGAYTVLAPRQLIRAAPEALRASAAAAAPWSGLTGVPPGFADGIDNNSGGTVTSIAAGTGLSGGTITGSGTIAIAAGGVGLAQIDPTQVQARIGGDCGEGEYLRGINADGSVACGSLLAYLGINLATTVANPAGGLGSGTAINVPSDGLPLIAYVEDDTSGSFLKVARCTNTACTGAAIISTVDDPVNSVGSELAMAIGRDGLPVISYRDSSAQALKVAKCSNIACTGTATITTVDDPANSVGLDTSIAVGADGNPVISYRDSTANALKVAKCANAACTGLATITTVDDPVNSVGAFSDIAIASDGRPVISHYDATDGNLKVSKCTNAACTGTAIHTTVDDSSSLVGFYNSIAIPADGRPVISYYNVTAGSLKLARCANPDCSGVATINVVDVNPGIDVGEFNSIAIGSDGLPVISYREKSAGAVRVAKCSNVDCSAASITTVDDPVNAVGLNISLAIGTDGLPIISHRGTGSAGGVKVLKCATLDCQ